MAKERQVWVFVQSAALMTWISVKVSENGWMDGWMDAHVNYPNTAELNWVSLSYHSPPKSVK